MGKTQSHWDIPKGKIEPNEVSINGALRELEEETGIKAPWKELKFLGIFEYRYLNLRLSYN